jgi:hypothetical protein
MFPGAGFGPRWRRAPRKTLGGSHLKNRAGRDAFQGCVEQQQSLEDRLPQGPVRLLQPGLTLAVQLLLDVAVGEDRQHRHGQQGTPHEQRQEPAAELAPQRCGRESHMHAWAWSKAASW